MKNILKLSFLLTLFILTACQEEDNIVTIDTAIVGKWKNSGRIVEGVYTEGADCAQLETYIFSNLNNTGVGHAKYCNNQFPEMDFEFVTTEIAADTYQFAFKNGGPWLIETGSINVATVVNDKLHIETFQASQIDNPNRSYYIAVYEKVINEN